MYDFRKVNFTLTAISKRTDGRSLQFIDVKSSTILDLNVITPVTATAWPMVTNFPTHYTLSDGRMSPLQPPWSMRTTATFSWAFGGHPNTSFTSEAIPAFGKSSARLITSEWALTSVSHTTINAVQNLVTHTWIQYCKGTSVKPLACFTLFQRLEWLEGQKEQLSALQERIARDVTEVRLASRN